MYIVVSKWEIPSERREQFENYGGQMREFLRGLPGVEFAHSIRTEDGNGLAVIAYRDEQTYRRLIQDPNGPFETKARELGIEQHGRWLWSERGETVDQPTGSLAGTT